MPKMIHLLQADARRLVKTPFFLLHVLIPAVGVSVVLVYLAAAPYRAEDFAIVYFQGLALIYPILVSWMCSIVSAQEVEAGGGFFMLSAPSRGKALLSKVIYLLFFSFIACMLATLGYAVLIPIVRPDDVVHWQTYLKAGMILWGCSVFLSLFHLFMDLRFGRNVSFAVSAVEFLLSALMITGLGTAIWFFFPSAWGIRLVALYTAGTVFLPQWQTAVGTGATVMGTMLMAIFLFRWFLHFEGRKIEE